MRPLAKTGVALLLTLAFAYVFATVVISILNGGDVIRALVVDAWRGLFTGGAVAFGLFVLFLLIANVAGRRRGSGSQFWINAGSLIVALVIGTALTSAVGALLGFFSVGSSDVSVLGTLVTAGELFFAGILALALTHFVVFRPRATEFEP